MAAGCLSMKNLQPRKKKKKLCLNTQKFNTVLSETCWNIPSESKRQDRHNPTRGILTVNKSDLHSQKVMFGINSNLQGAVCFFAFGVMRLMTW